MLAVDWLGLALTVLLLTLLLSGRLRLARALIAIALAELSRLALVLLTGGTLTAWTVGGAFSRVEGAVLSAPIMQGAGYAIGVILGLLLSRKLARDMSLYALLAVGATLFLREV